MPSRTPGWGVLGKAPGMGVMKAGGITLLTGLTAYWKVDEANDDAIDATGRGNTLADTGAPGGVAGKIGNARQFSGAQLLSKSTTGTDDLSLGNIDWTIAFWFQVANASAIQIIMVKTNGASIGEFGFYTNGSKLNLAIYNGAGNIGLVTVNVALSNATWYFGLARFRAADQSYNLRVNLTQADGPALTGTPAASNHDWRIGSRGGGGLPMTGLIDEIGVWKRYLSDAECVRLYNGGAGLTYPFDPTYQVVYEGDSMTVGTFLDPTLSYPFQTMVLAGRHKYSNVGASGNTVATMLTQAAAQVDAVYSTIFAKNLAVLWGGTNDIGSSGRSAADTYADIKTWHAGRKAAGFTTIALTIAHRQYAGDPADINDTIDACNALIRADNAGADYLVDVAANANLLDPTNGTYFSDALHMTAAGYGVVAGMVAATIRAI